MTNALDRQVGGSHYKNQKYEVIEFLMDYKLNTALGYAIKYISRYPNKNPDDLDKALHCVEIFADWFKKNTIITPEGDWEIPYFENNFNLLFKFSHQFEGVKSKLIQQVVFLQDTNNYFDSGSLDLLEFHRQVEEVRQAIIQFKEGTYK